MMKLKYLAALLLPFMLLFTPAMQAQFVDQGFGGGMAYGGTLGQTGPQDNNKVGYLVRAFVRQGLASSIAAELGFANGRVYGTEYSSIILPWELKILVSPFDIGPWNVYVSAGFGAMRVWKYSKYGELENLDDVFSMAYAPIGIGFQRMINSNIALELRGEFNYGFGDWLSTDFDGSDDAYITVALGFTWVGSMGKDSDGDGLTDAREAVLGTDPRNPDTDDDGLRDGEEVNDYGTNPKVKDTDTGSVNDGAEVLRGTDPLNADDDVQYAAEEVGVPITLDGITFNTGSAEILPASENTLKKAFNTLYFNPDIEVEIQGHTDNTGSRETNMKLSLERANSVKDWLVNRGIDGNRITTKGYGPDMPKASNDTEEGKKQNRRIEFVRTK